MRRSSYIPLSVLASLAIAGGPAISAAHADSVERLARKDAEARKRSKHRAESPASPDSPGQSSESGKPDGVRASFVSPAAAKPTDSDSSNLNICLAAALDELPGATLQTTQDVRPLLSIRPALHRLSYQAHAPPSALR